MKKNMTVAEKCLISIAVVQLIIVLTNCGILIFGVELSWTNWNVQLVSDEDLLWSIDLVISHWMNAKLTS
jgi:hypothetical protein